MASESGLGPRPKLMGRTTMAGSADGVQPARSVLGRAMAILDSFSTDRPEQSLAGICHSTGLPSATAYRLIAELVEHNVLQRVERGRYRIGMRLWQLGSQAPVARDLRDIALPFLQDLLEVCHEVVHLAVVDGQQLLFVERLMAHPHVRTTSRVARRLPLHATGPGKVLLAFAAPDFVEEVIGRGLTKQAKNTITDPLVLRRELAEIRQRGHALSRDEMTDGASSVSAPIRGVQGQVIAGISVVVPTGRDDLQKWVPAVRLAAAGITRALAFWTP